MPEPEMGVPAPSFDEQQAAKDQEAPQLRPSTIVRDRLMAVIVINKEMIQSAEKILEIVKEHPELDTDFARVFGIRVQ